MNNTINIKIKLLNENAKVPAKKHEKDIGYDLFSDNEYLLKAQSVTMVHLGISIEFIFYSHLRYLLLNIFAYFKAHMILNQYNY